MANGRDMTSGSPLSSSKLSSDVKLAESFALGDSSRSERDSDLAGC
jgi:hypothetical protein